MNRAKKMRFEKLRNYIEKRLKEELSPNYHYHSYAHTMDVLNAALQYADLEEIDEHEIELLKVAVLFHDSGFIQDFREHEKIGCEIAREVLPHFDYSEDEIKIIYGMIMATKIPQSPKNKLEQIICDADLDYLGRNDFWEIGQNLYKELLHLKVLKNEGEWNLLQIKFLESHAYFTEHAIERRSAKKQEHLEMIKSKTNGS